LRRKSAAALLMPALPMAMGRKHGGRPRRGLCHCLWLCLAPDASALGDTLIKNTTRHDIHSIATCHGDAFTHFTDFLSPLPLSHEPLIYYDAFRSRQANCGRLDLLFTQ